jgi:hypothetical protein
MNDTTKNVTILDLDAMMDIKMDEVETLPDFVTPPPGLYTLTVKEAKIEKYKSKAEPNVEKSRIRLSYSVTATKEVAAGNVPVADGSMFSETFMATEDGIKFFKKAAMGVLGVSSFEGASIKDVIDGLADTEFEARITVRSTTDAMTKQVYENVNVRAINAATAA